MSKVDKTIWGRKLQLKVIYDCFEDEEITPFQEKTLSSFLGDCPEVELSLASLKSYCEKHSAGKIKADDMDNVYKYVVPRSIFVMRKPKGTFALLCDFKFDIEHGIAIVFKDGKLERITTQNAVM